jgi:hypothetical protein
MKDKLTQEYAAYIAPHLELAKKAYGSRATKSPQHDASREYTRLLVEFYSKGGSLLQLAKELNVTYAGIRRRVLTAEIPAKSKGTNSKSTEAEISDAAYRIKFARGFADIEGDSTGYHEIVLHIYETEKVSLNKIAKVLGMSSANPLYYAVSKAKLRREQIL